MPPLDPKLVKQYDPEFVKIHNIALKYGPPLWKIPLHRFREGYKVPLTVESVDVASTKDYKIKVDGGEIVARVWTPKGTAPKEGWPIFYHIHGGGWVIGGLETEAAHMTVWAEAAKCVVLTIDYRLAPEHIFPTAVNDCTATYEWIVENASRLNINRNKIAVGGSSAGGSLTANICHYVNQNPQKHLPKPVLQVLIVPSVDARHPDSEEAVRLANTAGLPLQLMKYFMDKYIPDPAQRSDPWASPIMHPDESFKNQPPAAIFTGSMDILKLDADRYAKKLREHGNEIVYYKQFEGASHLFVAFSGYLKQGREAVNEVGRLLRDAFYGSELVSSKL